MKRSPNQNGDIFWTLWRISALEELWQTDLTLDEIAAKMGVTRNAIHAVRKRLKLIPRPQGKIIDLIGQRFGKLSVLSFSGLRNHGAVWLCRCDCGQEKEIAAREFVRSRGTISCGCVRRQRVRECIERNTIHGQAKKTSEWKTWADMKRRCNNPKHHGYKWYGARGIKVCERWSESFLAFFSDMGPKPSPKLSIDRLNNDGNYEPGNCRWATSKEQAANRRRPTRRAA